MLPGPLADPLPQLGLALRVAPAALGRHLAELGQVGDDLLVLRRPHRLHPAGQHPGPLGPLEEHLRPAATRPPARARARRAAARARPRRSAGRANRTSSATRAGRRGPARRCVRASRAPTRRRSPARPGRRDRAAGPRAGPARAGRSSRAGAVGPVEVAAADATPGRVDACDARRRQRSPWSASSSASCRGSPSRRAPDAGRLELDAAASATASARACQARAPSAAEPAQRACAGRGARLPGSLDARPRASASSASPCRWRRPPRLRRRRAAASAGARPARRAGRPPAAPRPGPGRRSPR